jgi:hypothetical protein
LTKRDALYAQLPRLKPGNHQITSDASDEYNCVAWVERDQRRWWEPGFYWPIGDDPDPSDDVGSFVEQFRRLGFEICDSPDLEDGYLKIALFVEGGNFQHVAKQLPSGRWSSKAGPLHDIRHDSLDVLDEVGMWRKATAMVFMKRPYDGEDPFELEEGELVLP